MDPSRTHLAIVLDASGSMEQQRDETISGLNHFIGEQQKIPGPATVSLIQFAYVPSYVWRNADLGLVVPLTRDHYAPRGGTALLDAMGMAIDDTGRYLRSLAPEMRPGKVVVLTMTDGAENSSHGYSKIEVAAKIRHQQDKYQWQFLFLGADMATINEVQSMGVRAGSTMSWEPQVVGGAMRGMVANNAAISNYRMGHTVGATYESNQVGGEVFGPLPPTPGKAP